MTIPQNLRTAAARTTAERLASELIAANDNTPPRGRKRVSRHTRPAMNWSMKHDPFGAACLWLVARQRLPDDTIVANDNHEPVEGGLEVRRNGTARGKSKAKKNLGAHLALPAVLPRLGDGEPQPARTGNWGAWYDMRPQNDVDELSDNFEVYGSCADAIAAGCDFMGAESGLGTPRPGKSKGSPLKVDEHEFDEPPDDINLVIETMLARGDLATVGRAFGAQGRYADKKGAELLRKAMEWAKEQIAESNFRANVTNRVA
ncbi:hypothetical protein HGP14_07870 [Rhizobium sp. P32RR-XVIII]|uniref:hypothetical protein n=1 Tax=Rhizobium sp. P32RR-XVIII TaxID=2726738 RepID=UPI0014563386|nr:hypothetical protein [Rhizobium sp. P32RR-XVIII]NLS03287.1 hypothetical protein [Rhizobium sp. P32RR-XVIII]